MSVKYRLLLTMLALTAVVGSVALVHAPPANTPPNIGTPVINFSSPGPSDTVTVSVNVTSARSTVKNVTVTYTIDNWKATNSSIQASYNATTTNATAKIPPLTTGGKVSYYVVAYDLTGLKAVNNNSGAYFSYNVTAPQGPASTTATLTYILVTVAIGAAISVVAIMILKAPMGSTKKGPSS